MKPGESRTSSGRPPLGASLRGLTRSVLSLLHVRLELISLEAKDGALRLGELLLYGALALVFLCVGLVFLAVFLTVLLWDSHRLLVLGVFTGLFLAAGAVALVWARRLLSGDQGWFVATRAELQRDLDRLRP